jgi:hypothetical protein
LYTQTHTTYIPSFLISQETERAERVSERLRDRRRERERESEGEGEGEREVASPPRRIHYFLL